LILYPEKLSDDEHAAFPPPTPYWDLHYHIFVIILVDNPEECPNQNAKIESEVR
jgi:hypothetical protein